jgi:hypothetical protein
VLFELPSSLATIEESWAQHQTGSAFAAVPILSLNNLVSRGSIGSAGVGVGEGTGVGETGKFISIISWQASQAEAS